MEPFDNQENQDLDPTAETTAGTNTAAGTSLQVNNPPEIDMPNLDDTIGMTNDTPDTSFGQLDNHLSNSIKTPSEIDLSDTETIIDASYNMPDTNFGQLN